jgi:hypothetical protein
LGLRNKLTANPEPIDEAAKKTGALIRDLQERLTGAGEGQGGGLLRELQSRVQQGDAKAGLLMRELENLRRAAGQSATLPDEPGSQETVRRAAAQQETEEDLERQMVDYFERSARPAVAPAPAGDLRSRVVDGVADRLLSEWMPEGDAASLEAQVIERMVQRVFERLQARRPMS